MKDISGLKFGRLTVLKRHSGRFWRCLCDCGNISIVRADSLKTGNTSSCGCFEKSEKIRRATTHGGFGTKEYLSWRNARSRCLNKKDEQYARYGGRGIKMCDRWLAGFGNFISDMGKCPTGLTLGRIDNDGPYSPENCRWEDKIAQANNRRSSRLICFKGRSETVANWCRIMGFKQQLISRRIDILGWSIERAMTQQPRRAQ